MHLKQVSFETSVMKLGKLQCGRHLFHLKQVSFETSVIWNMWHVRTESIYLLLFLLLWAFNTVFFQNNVVYNVVLLPSGWNKCHLKLVSFETSVIWNMGYVRTESIYLLFFLLLWSFNTVFFQNNVVYNVVQLPSGWNRWQMKSDVKWNMMASKIKKSFCSSLKMIPGFFPRRIFWIGIN